MEVRTISSNQIREEISEYINKRLQDKLKNKITEKKRAELLYSHQYEQWLEQAADTVSLVQQVTHGAKFTHPSSQASSFFCSGNQFAGDDCLGTHSLNCITDDGVSNDAKNLYVYNFLKLDIGGYSILDLVCEGSSELKAAFSNDKDKAENWMKAFASLISHKKAISSDSLSKQLYWPLSSEADKVSYHLISPVFSSSLSQAVWAKIREHQFSTDFNSSNDVQSENVWAEKDSFEYPKLVVQKFGGKNPQNVSQLNSKRYGENYLLASLPPYWNSNLLRPPLCTDSIFSGAFGGFQPVNYAVNDLRDYLENLYHPGQSSSSYTNIDIRERRRRKVQVVLDEFFHFSASVWDLESGWSAEEDCNLPEEERCWLDQGRVLFDEEFAKTYRRGYWKEQVAERFANWLNARLASGKKKLPVGKAEFDEWKKLVEKEINLFRGVED
jgi:CRISPR-associated protein Csy1